MFSKQAILSAIQQKLLTIEPFELAQVESAHINLHITQEATVKPKGFVLASTVEKLTLTNNICGMIEGRASLAKQGISVEQSSTFVEPGTDNHITLEVFNASDKAVTLIQGQEIAKIIIMKVVDAI